MPEQNVELITDEFQRYRIVSRSIWNLFFWPNPDLANWDGRDQFDRIRAILFEALVTGNLDSDKSLPIWVIPKAEGVPAKIEQPRPGDRNHYWDHPVRSLGPREVVLEFSDFFDWDLLGCRDFRYVRARILQFPTHSELVGREVLLDIEDVEIAVQTPTTEG